MPSFAWRLVAHVRFPRLHALLREAEGRTLRGQAEDDQETPGGQAQAGQGLADGSPSPAHRGTGTLARLGCARTSRVLLGPGQHPPGKRVPRRGHPALASGASSSQPENQDELAADATPLGALPPSRPLHPPMARPALRRQNPSQEPSALAAHAGICAGGRSQRAVPTGAPGMTSSSGVQVPRGGDDTNHKPRATASS
jgi:hypothetical protein